MTLKIIHKNNTSAGQAPASGDLDIGEIAVDLLLELGPLRHGLDDEVAVEEVFGPLLTVYVYPDGEYEETLRLCDATSPYGLTGSVFATATCSRIDG